MVYQNKFVAVVKCDGKILRELDNTVILPFKSDYSILLKNLNSNSALVKVSIDGNDVLSNKSLIIKANSEYELTGFIEKDNCIKNRFRFIQKTENIVNHRGDNISDGLIRIEYTFEKNYYTYSPPLFRHFNSQNILCGCNIDGHSNNISYTASTNLYSDEGITVKGEQTHSQLTNGTIGPLQDQSDVIILKLKGENNNKEYIKPITVNDKICCETCGKYNSYTMNFCPNCGTAITK